MEPASCLGGVRDVREASSDADGPAALYAASYARLVGVLTLAAASRAEAEDVVQEAIRATAAAVGRGRPL